MNKNILYQEPIEHPDGDRHPVITPEERLMAPIVVGGLVADRLRGAGVRIVRSVLDAAALVDPNSKLPSERDDERQ